VLQRAERTCTAIWLLSCARLCQFGVRHDEGSKTKLIRLAWACPALIEGWIPHSLRGTEIGRRELLRTARAGLLAVPALVHSWWSFERILPERQEACPEELPWEEQAEIDRREFFRKACDSLGQPRTMERKSDTTVESAGTGRAWPSPSPDGLLVWPVWA